jgi:hypothetical protein
MVLFLLLKRVDVWIEEEEFPDYCNTIDSHQALYFTLRFRRQQQQEQQAAAEIS